MGQLPIVIKQAVWIVDIRYFSVQATANPSSNLYGWIFASAGKMKNTEPQESVEGFRKVQESFAEPFTI